MTKSRAAAACMLADSPSFVVEKRRYLTRKEMLRLQGFKDNTIDTCRGDISFREFARLMGNAMNVAVLRRILIVVVSHI